jgi:hypothetical protein
VAVPTSPVPEMLRLAESLVYERNEDASQRAGELANQYWTAIKELPPEKLAAKKDEIKHLRNVCNYLIKFKILSPDVDAKAQLDQMIKEQNWDKK